MQLNWHMSQRLEFESKLALVRGWDVEADNWLIYMPSDRWDNSLRYTIDGKDRWSFGASSVFVASQSRFPEGVDLSEPPDAYHLINVFAESTIPFGKNNLKVSLSADNLFDTAWRDYLDRFRYYADSMGRNIVVRLKYSFL
jgi:iron complex outermembrane receptor protein